MQQSIKLVQAHNDQMATPQMSDESFHDANEDYMPSDDDFVHNTWSMCTKPAGVRQKQQIPANQTF